MNKYPRTPHLAGSRLQPGDDERDQVTFAEIRDRDLVVAEKLDGANTGVSFTSRGELRLQSRGHYLTGGPRERQFALFKSWAAAVAPVLQPALRDRYVLYGEWLYAKHTLYYDALPHERVRGGEVEGPEHVFEADQRHIEPTDEQDALAALRE